MPFFKPALKCKDKKLNTLFPGAPPPRQILNYKEPPYEVGYQTSFFNGQNYPNLCSIAKVVCKSVDGEPEWEVSLTIPEACGAG